MANKDSFIHSIIQIEGRPKTKIMMLPRRVWSKNCCTSVIGLIVGSVVSECTLRHSIVGPYSKFINSGAALLLKVLHHFYSLEGALYAHIRLLCCCAMCRPIIETAMVIGDDRQRW